MPRRIVILGGPHTGKTTLSTCLGISNVRHSDDIKHLGWSESSEAASHWFNEQGDWVAEGVQMARALRKWLKASPNTPLDVDIVKLSKPFDELIQGQQSMAKGIETVFAEIESELIQRGARIHRLNNPNEAVDLFREQNMPEDPTAKPPTSEEDGKNPAGKPEGEGTPPKPEDADKKFTQDDLNTLAAKVRKEEKDKAQAAKDKEEKERLEADAVKQGEFEKLANDRKAKLDELEPQLASATAEVEKYKVTVAELVEAELKELPAEVKDIAPVVRAEDKSLTNPLDVLAWLPKGKALAEKLDGSSAVKGTPKSPRANGAHGDPKADDRAKAEAQRAYRD